MVLPPKQPLLKSIVLTSNVKSMFGTVKYLKMLLHYGFSKVKIVKFYFEITTELSVYFAYNSYQSIKYNK